MSKKTFKTIGRGTLALTVLSLVWQVNAQDAKALYSSMASIDQYLITDRNAEIALGSKNPGPREAWLRDRGRGQERLGLRCGEIVDVPIRQPGVLEPQAPRADLLQSARSTIRPAHYLQEDGDGIGGTFQSSDNRQY